MEARTTMAKRKYQRGAALVEAAIVAPIFAMFWLMMIHISGVYQYKIETSQESRYASFYRATNGCDGTTGAGAYHEANTVDGDGPSQTMGSGGMPSTNGTGGSLGNVNGAQGNDSQLVATATSDATWSYTNGASVDTAAGHFSLSSQQVETQSSVVCNEKPQGINVVGYLGNVVGEITSAIKL